MIRAETARKAAIGQAFGRAAAGYDAHADVQARVAAALAGRIATLNLPAAARVLEIGCGTGQLTQALLALLPEGWVMATDIAPGMVRLCRARLAAAVGLAVMDGETPCVASGAFDLVCASMVFQWFADLPGALTRLRAVLRPGGCVAFATLGSFSFAAWRAAQRAEGGLPPQPYPDPARIAAAWHGRASIAAEVIRVQHGTGLTFLRTLRAIGAGVPPAGRAVLSPGALRRALGRFERESGATAEYEILYVTLWA